MNRPRQRDTRTRKLLRLVAAPALVGFILAASFSGSRSPSATAAPTTTTGPVPTTTTAKPTTTTAPGPGSTTTTSKPAVTSTTTAPSSTTTTTTRTRSTTTTTTTPTPAAAPAAPGVSLVSQPPWIPTEGVEVLGLHLDENALATTSGAEVELTIHHSVTSRTDFDNAVSGESLGSTRSRLTFSLSQAQLNPKTGNFLVGFGLSGSGASRQVGIDSAGVYPVEVGVIDSGVTRSTFVTWMVVVDPAASKSSVPLRVSWIWRLETNPAERPDGSTDPAALAAMQPGGRLDTIARLIGSAGKYPLTLEIGPQTLTIWAKAATTNPALAQDIDRVRASAARTSNQVLPQPYVPIDGPTIEAEGLGPYVPGEYVAGSDAVNAAIHQIPDPRTAFVDPIDNATIARLTQMLVGRFVVRDSALTPIDESLTPAQPFMLTTSSGVAAPSIATDTGLELLVASPGPPALRAQRVMAALAEIAYEAPSQARGVVLATPREWSPDSKTVSLLLRDLAHDPLVRPASLNSLFAAVPAAEANGTALERQLAPVASNAHRPLDAAAYDTAALQLRAYAGMVGGQKDPSVAAGQHALLLSLSTANTGKEANAYLETIALKLDGLTSGITTTAKTLTLTARRADLPLSFQNNTGREVNIRVHLESPKLIFPKGPNFTLALPVGHTTAKPHEFPVEARASGTFAMTITLESPDGLVTIGLPTRVTIRSAVFSGIGIALTLGALVFLAGWWGTHFWRTRRARHRALAT